MSLLKKQWSIMLCLILSVSLNSCQKDLITEAKPDNVSGSPLGVSTISFGELQKRIKISEYGIYNSVLANANAKDEKFQLRDDIILLTDKVTMITGNGMTTYTMAVQQKAGQRATFQNVIFVDRKGIIETHLLTYKASKWFAAKLKADKRAVFEGYVSYSILDKRKPKGTVNSVSAETCVYYDFYYSQPYKCLLSGDHWPGDTRCQAYGQANGAGYETRSSFVSTCTRTGAGSGTWVTTSTASGGGGGSGGGSVMTYPTLPLNYNPNCEYGYSSVSKVKSSGISTSNVGDGDCAYDDPNPAGLIANINKLTGILGLDWSTQEFLHDKDAIQGNTLTLDMINYVEGNTSSPNAINFATWSINYLKLNPSYSYPLFKDQFINETADINSAPVTLPALLDTTGLYKYPRFKQLVMNLPGFLNQYPNVKRALVFYTGFSENRIMELMQPGKGPRVVVVPNSVLGPYAMAHYNSLDKTLEIKESWVNGLENVQLQKNFEGTALLLAITTFHEFVHYGRNANKLGSDYYDSAGIPHEAGWQFEYSISPGAYGINTKTAFEWLKFYPYNFE